MGVLLPSLPCGSWTLNSAILAGLLFSKLGKKKMTPRTQKFLTVNELYFPTPKFELWFDNFVVLICEFIYKISMSSVVVHACYPSTWKIKKRSSLGYIVSLRLYPPTPHKKISITVLSYLTIHFIGFID